MIPLSVLLLRQPNLQGAAEGVDFFQHDATMVAGREHGAIGNLEPQLHQVVLEQQAAGSEFCVKYQCFGGFAGQLLHDVKATFPDRSIHFTGVDFSAEMLAVAQHRNPDMEFIQSRTEEFKPERPYDIILSTHSFPYYSDKLAQMRAFGEMLTPDGTVIIANASLTANGSPG